MPRAAVLGAVLLILAASCSLAGGSPETLVADMDDGNATAYPDVLQNQFILGGIALQNRDYDAAIAIFRDLARKSPSPRIRLELARALFLAQRLDESREVFEQVLAGDILPWPVRQNIELYLREIDRTLGFVKYGISLVSDSNPRNFTSDRRIMIAGQVLTIVPPQDNKEVRGIRYRVEMGKALSGDRQLQGYMNLSFIDYEQSQFDRITWDGRLTYAFDSLPRLNTRAGIEISTRDGSKQYDYPYLSFIYIPDPVERFRLLYELKIARLDITGVDHLDADQYIAAMGFTRHLHSLALLRGDISLENSVAKESPYSYHGASLGLGVDFAIGNWALEPFLAVAQRVYGDQDPLFGRTRKDTRQRAGLAISPRNFRIGRFTPELGFTYDKNDSSIGFYSYDKLGLFLSLEE